MEKRDILMRLQPVRSSDRSRGENGNGEPRRARIVLMPSNRERAVAYTAYDYDREQNTAQRMADGLHDAVGQAGSVASQTGEGIAEFRRVVRAQPITMALLLLGFGYVVGRVFSAKSASSR
jgi:hypothetical protein